MAFKHTLLGILIDQPMSGYSLSKRLFVPFRRPLSQIYRTLNKMTEEGLLEAEKVVQDKLPSQNVYCVTEAGRAELMRWLKQPESVAMGQMEVLSKLWLGGKVEKQVILSHLQSFEKHVQEQLEYFKGKAKPWVEARAKQQGHTVEAGGDERGYTVETAYQLLTVEYAIGQYEVALQWARRALQEIAALAPGEETPTVAETTKPKKRKSAREAAAVA